METASLCDLECKIQNLLVGFGFNFIPSDTMMLKTVCKDTDDYYFSYLMENKNVVMVCFIYHTVIRMKNIYYVVNQIIECHKHIQECCHEHQILR